MGISWTGEQKQVIEERNKNILVAAGAGSGKTAVLVARIMDLIMDRVHPMDVDELLIVTFTKAAAAEMRERIIRAIERQREENPENEHLLRQTVLVHNAQITTIDGFCMEVLKSNFFKLDLEPGFRVGDEGECKLLKAEIAGEVLNRFYEEKDESFLRFIENFSTGKNDSGIIEKILTLYELAMGNPWPKRWLSQCEKWYHCDTTEEMLELPVMQLIKHYVSELVRQCSRQMYVICRMAEETDGPGIYAPLLMEEAQMLKGLSEKSSYTEYREAFLSIEFKRLPAARKFEGDQDKKEYVKNVRTDIKKTIKGIQEEFFFGEEEELFQDMDKTKEMVQVLVALTKSFMDAFRERKKQLNLVDFTDMEHFALEILTEEGTGFPTKTAEEYQNQFREIMIDEYQDSNLVQEILLKGVSKCSRGENNIFMVGDVKQSIYRFRLARPELFMEKYESYEQDGGTEQRIDLHRNFRSRIQVIETVNDMFGKIMHKDLGNVEYDKRAELRAGTQYPDSEGGSFSTEICLYEAEEEERIGDIILKQIHNGSVTDESSGEIRRARFSDIAVLLRNPSGWADGLAQTLKNKGILAHTTSKTGYFSAEEVSDVLSLLRIIDNKKQDIPLAAALTSPFGGFTANELAVIKASYREERFFNSYRSYLEERKDALGEKLKRFDEQITVFRKLSEIMPVHELLQTIYIKTGYLNQMAARPDGEKCLANLEMLLEKAIAFEQTSYHGVLQFLNYIRQLQKYSIDYGSGKTVSEGDNAVRIMSIHSSKGLEFPIVIVAGLGRRFNLRDAANSLILHPQYGIGMDCIDGIQRTKKRTVVRSMLSKQIILESLGEELRVLYVAMTRAKDKLILAGGTAKLENELNVWKLEAGQDELSFMDRAGAGCYLDWLMPALLSFGEKYPVTILNGIKDRGEEQGKPQWAQSEKECFLNNLEQPNSEMTEFLQQRFSYVYPYEEEQNLKMKVSVSELKHRAMQGRLQQEEGPIFLEVPEKTLPRFMGGKPEENQGAARGTAVHRFLECFDFSGELSEESIQGQMEKVISKGRVSKEEMELVVIGKVLAFLNSDTAKRMQRAVKCNRLHKEQPFVMGILAAEADASIQSKETVLVQGIIDAYWEEEDGLVLLDYKTDRVTKKDELTDRYQKQMELYARALTQATGKRVKEKLIYSFALEKEIFID